MPDSALEVNEFKLQLCYYIHFRTNALWKYYIAMMISITRMIIQADSVVSDTNGFINFWLQSLAIRGETHNS